MEGLFPSIAGARITFASLPPELLGEIFVQCSVQNPDAPLLLRQVSKSFEDVVYSTPRAWEHLTLHTNEATSTIASNKAQLWFRHSGSCLVNVRLEIDQGASKCLMGGACRPAPSPIDALSSTLSPHVDCIRTLDILAPSETEARSLLDALFADPTQSITPATQSISIRISSSTPPNLRLSSLSATFPHLPNLQRLTLTNHTISFLSSADLENLRELSISCPIRFPPISVGSIMDILRRSPVLESLSIESRVVEEPLASPSQLPSPGTPTGSGNEAQGAGGSNPSLPIDYLNTPAATASDAPANPLVHLPSLTSLSLRTNAVPPILSQLLLPNLNRLHIDDLNGRRRGASSETAGVLRQLLVRMELPNEYRKGHGLRALELVGVDVGAQNANPSNVPQEIGNPNGAGAQAEGDATWAWCFKRMVALEELAVRKTDVGPVLELLAAPAVHSPIEPRPPQALSQPTYPVATSQQLGQCAIDVDAVVCPRLRSCSLTTTSGSASGPAVTAALVDRFRDARPEVDLNVERVQDPFFQSLATGPVDFLSLYCDSPRPSPGLEKVAAKGSSARRTGMRPPFGPWVVLGHGTTVSA